MGDEDRAQGVGNRKRVWEMSLADWGVLIGIVVGLGGLLFTAYEVMGGGDPAPLLTPAPITMVAVTEVAATEAPPAVQIRYVECGQGGEAEAEYVELINVSEETQDISYWKIEDEKNHVFTFGEYQLEPGATLKVWTDGVHVAANDVVWGYGTNVWNDDRDVATLWDREGDVVHMFSYP